MIFAEFITHLYNNNDKITRKEDFVIQALETSGIKFYYSNDVAKKICSIGPSNRPISNELRNTYKNKFELCVLASFFESNLNKNRINDLFECFSIPMDEKKDFSIFTEAIAMQFDNYFKFGETNILSTVSDLYLTLCDQYGNGSNPNANTDAIFAAKQCYYTAVKHLKDLKPHDEIINLKGPFESFFKELQNSFKVFESKCNRAGRDLFRQVRNEIIAEEIPNYPNDINFNEVLELMTEPGSLPLNIIKTLDYVIYDGYLGKDETLQLSIRLFDDFNKNLVINSFKEKGFTNTNEVCFTEYINFKIDGNDRNLLLDAYYILVKVEIILNYLESKFPEHKNSKVLNDKLDKLYQELQLKELEFFADGTFLPLESKIIYHPSMEVFFGNNGGPLVGAGYEPIKADKIHFWKYATNNDERLYHYFLWHQFWLNENKANKMMTEYILLREDGSVHLFMFPPTCKAKQYRKVREFCNMVFDQKIIGFMTVSIAVQYPDTKAIRKMTSFERMPHGIEILQGLGYFDKKFVSYWAPLGADHKGIHKEDSIQIKSFVLAPLIKEIKMYEFFKEHINDNIKKEGDSE